MKEINILFVSKMNIDIEQELGEREDATISQKTITEEFDKAKESLKEERGRLQRIVEEKLAGKADVEDIYSKKELESTVAALMKNHINEQSVKYLELLSLRNEAGLVPGRRYRITDYITTTKAENIQSAGHQFDIILVADTDSTLNENAYATLHEGDDYFIKSNLSSWKLKYCLDNDAVRFSWAYPDEPTGIQINGEIFQRDESSDVDYQGERYVAYTNGELLYYVKADAITNEETQLYEYVDEFPYGKSLVESTAIIQNVQIGEIKGRGVIYYMEDEFGNVAGYDFKNIQFKASEDIDALHIKAETYYYTFSKTDDNWDVSDNSLNDQCRRNVIEECYEETFCLGFNFFNCTALFPSCSHNYLGFNSRDNIFGGTCYRNKLGVGCCGNIFHVSTADNLFGNHCHNNNIGPGCERNLFYNKCSENSLDLVCIGNIFLNDCVGRKLAGYASYSTYRYI